MDDAGQHRAIAAILRDLGVDDAEIPGELSEAAALASDRVLDRDDVYTLRQIADRLAIPLADVSDYFLHLGIQVDDPDTVRFTESDLDMARFLNNAISDVLTEEEGREILHVVATALSTIAEAAIAGHVQGPESRTRDYVENARLNAFIAELGLDLSSYLGVAFRHHLRQSALINRNAQSISHRALVNLSVGFLDLVGFTSVSQELSVEELVDLVKAFESRAHELAHECRARIVKLIGDEVMIVAEKPADAARFVIGMLETFHDDGVVPRGGLAHGELINIHGDYFGPVVNLAARLTDAAVPGEVLVDDVVANHVATEPAGRRMLKGFSEPVRVHTLAPEPREQ